MVFPGIDWLGGYRWRGFISGEGNGPPFGEHGSATDDPYQNRPV